MGERLIGWMSLFGLAVVLALGGCGGSDDAEKTTAADGEAAAAKPPWARNGSGNSQGAEKFVAEAEAICNRGKRLAFAAMADYLKQNENSAKPDAQRLNDALKVAYVPIIKTQVQEIDGLDPPQGEGWQVRAFIVALKEGIVSEGRDSTSPNFGLAFKHSAELARALGINACVYSGAGLGGGLE